MITPGNQNIRYVYHAGSHDEFHSELRVASNIDLRERLLRRFVATAGDYFNDLNQEC